MSHIQSNISIPDMSKKPAKIPTTRTEFQKLGYAERAWMFAHERAKYDRFTRPLKPWEVE